MRERDDFDYFSLLAILGCVAVLFFMIWAGVSLVTSVLGQGPPD